MTVIPFTEGEQDFLRCCHIPLEKFSLALWSLSQWNKTGLTSSAIKLHIRINKYTHKHHATITIKRYFSMLCVISILQKLSVNLLRSLRISKFLPLFKEHWIRETVIFITIKTCKSQCYSVYICALMIYKMK